MHLYSENHVRFIAPNVRPFHDLSGLMEVHIAQFAFSIYRLNMAAQVLCDINPRLAFIYSNSEGVPISFPLGSDGVAHVTSLRLSLSSGLVRNSCSLMKRSTMHSLDI